MKLHQITLLTLCITIIFGNTLLAQQDVTNDNENKTKLTIDIGFVIFHSTSNLDTDGKEEVDDNQQEGEGTSALLPFPLFDYRYTLRESQTELFFGTPLDGSDLSLSVGVSQPFDMVGVFSISFAPSWGSEVWKNPYLEKTKRKKTLVNQLTTRLTWEKIINLPLNLTYSHLYSDIRDDEIGDLYKELKRDGFTESMQATYDIGLSRTSLVSPGLLLEKSQLNGSANSYDKAGLSLEYKKIDRDYFFMLQMAANTASFDDEHPLYHETRKDNEVGVLAMLRLLNLFDVEAMHSNIIVGAGGVDSNIDFFDSRTSFLALTLGYTY